VSGSDLGAAIDRVYPETEALYMELHRNPELRDQEKKTAATLTRQLQKLGFEVTTGIGGTGFVGLLRNGEGPTLMLRTELDGLPIEEKTGLPYASKVTAVEDGRNVSVMHACGHDAHMATLIAAAKLLASQKQAWRGTLMLLGQPAEEGLTGARAMVADGLFTRFPKPDYALAIHVMNRLPAGQVAYRPGPTSAGVDIVAVTIYGKGGHASALHAAIDPI
jgi:hippurate hydrolase